MNPRGKALLIGNGVNLTAGLEPSWEDVVKDMLGRPRGKRLTPRMRATPLPLLIEEASRPSFSHAGEKRAQERLAALLRVWEPSPIHREILQANVGDIITTNYDTVLERASGQTFTVERPFIREARYSLFRRHRLADGKRVWHIHGSIQSPDTMMLGFEHYGGQLQALREIVVNQRHYPGKHKQYGPLKELIPKRTNEPPESWAEVALTHHLLILGLTLDFAELGLWWLLTYRTRRLNLDPKWLPATTIAYAMRRPRKRDAATRARVQQLKNCRVEIWEEDCDWVDLYRRALERFAQIQVV